MDLPLSKVTVDWSLIDIWCCGKFHSNVDILDHAQLRHVKHKTSSPKKISCRNLRSSLFGTSLLHNVEDTPFPKSPDIVQIGNRDCKRKRKESEDVNDATRLPSPKRRHLSERKSKSNAEAELANTTRVDSLTPSPDISDANNLFDDTNDVEGDRKNSMQNTFSDEVPLEKQQEAAEGRIIQISKIKDEDNGGWIVKRNTENKKSKVKANYPQKIKIKKEKVSSPNKDNSEAPMVDIESDSDNESVMFLQSYNMDFSCKVKGCHANFWFKSELDQHKADIHNS